MALPKYKKQYEDMISSNRALFENLKKAKQNSEEFREIQLKVLRIVTINENALCKRTEITRFSNFSSGLSDKFIELVRENYPELYFS